MLIGLTVFAAAAALLWAALGFPTASTARLDIIKVALTVVAGVGGVVALVVAYRKQRISESAETRERTKLLNERFGAACNQIGNEAPTVRLAGIYAMASLADEWPEQRQTCINVLCAYLRVPYEPSLDSEWYHDAESEVRLTLTSVIAQHLRDGAPVSWQGHDFDLVRAVLRSADFAGIVIPAGTVFLSLARFPGGWISFDGMKVCGGEVWFGGASFDGARVTFDKAEFSGGRVRFEGAEFNAGEVSFRGARFAGGEVDLSEAVVQVAPVFDEGEKPGLKLPST
ncbi:pentapeptide repeat-containing protein [Lentzea sp. BCCO 10_0856]|uniref:Pentapeptide repeat-containing protein n=1 Tax=Lentzea miocenica TaxID=3095431 RepID=A0ABU4SVH2_9PSEU|nr:pentapeptide repeat-containing protein [Lentzea sp. BCCO 10_0856]MDX8029886.1 pentapeptide repeat-containing protein [Lentzea sp. BCCO 10_0856]